MARISMILGLLLGLLSLPARAAEQKHLAVLEFEVAADLKIDRTYFADLARGAVKKRAPQLFVMTRESTEALLQANGKTMSDCTGECEVEVGRKLGADFIISGRLTQLGSRLALTMRLFSTADGALLASEEARGKSIDELVDEADQAVARLIAPLTKSARSTGSTNSVAEARIAGESRDVSLGENDVIVAFSSTPAGAVVLLDGQLLCQATPCSKLVAAGAHDVSMQREGFDTQTGQLEAKKGASMSLSLARVAARVAVESTPPGLLVRVDDQVAGRTPLAALDLAPGSHEIVVDDACWVREGERISLKRGEERTVRISPKERQAGLKVTAEDEKGNALEATVLVDGREVGTAPGSFKVSVCSKRVELRAGGLGFSQDLSLAEGKVESVHGKLTSATQVAPAAATESGSSHGIGFLFSVGQGGSYEFGGAFSMQLSGPLRYEANLALTDSSGNFGFKMSPLGFGLLFPILERDRLRLEIGATLPLVELRYISASYASGSATYVGFNSALMGVVTLTYASFFFTFEPGVDFRWMYLSSASQGGTTVSNTVTGFDPFYRFSFIAGWTF